MKRFRTNFENWDDALYYGLGGALTEETFKNWEFELEHTEQAQSEKWGCVHIDTEGYKYPESKVIYIL